MKFTTSNAVVAGVWVTVSLAICVSLMPLAHAQTFSVIHTFTGGADGATPLAGLTLDRAGNIYGTASNGGASRVGTVYRLKPSGSGWIFGVLHAFTDVPDGSYPVGGVIFGPDGALYGTTFYGGSYCVPDTDQGCGTVFRLSPPATFCRSVSCPWTENVVYSFQGYGDGTDPSGDLVFDPQGNAYGTTYSGGAYNQFLHGCLQRGDGGCGTVYQLTPTGSGWTHNVLYQFDGQTGAYPGIGTTGSDVKLDQFGNLYGTTPQGGLGIGGGNYGYGVIYELTPSTGYWAENILHYFTGGDDGAFPGGLTFDRAGNLYGGTGSGGLNGGGTFYELMSSMGGWNFNLLYSLSGSGGPGDLTMDGTGIIYGATYGEGAYGYGTVFKLSQSDGVWTYQDLYDFTGGSDGAHPSNVALDASGNLYGTTTAGGSNQCNCGVVWEITP